MTPMNPKFTPGTWTWNPGTCVIESDNGIVVALDPRYKGYTDPDIEVVTDVPDLFRVLAQLVDEATRYEGTEDGLRSVDASTIEYAQTLIQKHTQPEGHMATFRVPIEELIFFGMYHGRRYETALEWFRALAEDVSDDDHPEDADFTFEVQWYDPFENELVVRGRWE